MEARLVVLVLFCFLAAAASDKDVTVTLQNDQPSLRIPVSQSATLKCCYGSDLPDLNVTWTLTVMITSNETQKSVVNLTDERRQTCQESEITDVKCCSLALENVSHINSGLYRCKLVTLYTDFYTPGTYLQVFDPINKTLNLSESMKNSIITAEGVLLFLCVIIPGIMLLCKSQGLRELEKRKVKEEENIYEGLNLDDCTSTYHQIQRSQVQGPYQDVVNAVEEDIQFEKP